MSTSSRATSSSWSRSTKEGTPVKLTAEKAGETLTRQTATRLTGTPKSITLTIPGKSAQVCKV